MNDIKDMNFLRLVYRFGQPKLITLMISKPHYYVVELNTNDIRATMTTIGIRHYKQTYE